MQQVVSDLAAATSAEDVATVIVERSRSALTARGAALVVLVEDETTEPGALPALRPVRSVGLSRGLLAALREAASGQLALDWHRASARCRWTTAARDPARRRGGDGGGGLSTLVIVPVTADSRRLGVLILGLGGGGPGELLSLAEPGARLGLEVAQVDLMRTIGQQAGQALERARLHEQTVRQAERAAFLLDAARLLAGAVDVSDTVEKMAALAVDRLADLCVVDLETEQGLLRPWRDTVTRRASTWRTRCGTGTSRSAWRRIRARGRCSRAARSGCG